MVVTVAAAAPQVAVYTSGSGTYVTPAGALYLEVVLKGPGAGGAGSGTTPGAVAAPGADTTFGVLIAGKGGIPNGTTGGAGGAATGGDENIPGQKGAAAPSGYTYAAGGKGGGALGGLAVQGNAGEAAVANSGCGGAGGGADSTASPGGGGGEGGHVRKIIAAPAASYAYSVGAGSAGGAAGTNGRAGGNGAAGKIFVTAHFQ